MSPSTAAYRFLAGCLLGAALGLCYGFLRPFRRRHGALGDGLFVLAAAWVWVYFSFGICGGDIRLGYFGGMIAGGVLWEGTAGMLLRPVFRTFWQGLGKIGRALLLPVKKFLYFTKILFASVEKWVTIKCNIISSIGKRSGGEEKKNPLKTVKVEVRSASSVLKIVVTVLIVFSMAALLALRWVHSGILAQTQEMRDEASAVEYANDELRDKIDDIGSVQSVQDIAQQELGLVDPDTVIITPQS